MTDPVRRWCSFWARLRIPCDNPVLRCVARYFCCSVQNRSLRRILSKSPTPSAAEFAPRRNILVGSRDLDSLYWVEGLEPRVNDQSASRLWTVGLRALSR